MKSIDKISYIEAKLSTPLPLNSRLKASNTLAVVGLVVV